ncbi:MAG: LuxR family transcriptional regulator [Verrucomicrobiaceae bacterium]|nr:MAG: LuxR family transcriptional regulator [Verrucomicrobiaceae bacterium]
MTPPPSLTEADARTLIRLLGEVAAIERGYAAQKSALMDGVCKIIDADCWAWALACHYTTRAQPIYVGINHGGFTEERYARLLLAVEHPDIPAMSIGIMEEYNKQRAHITRLHREMDRDNLFESSKAFPLWIAAGIRHLAMSIRPVDEIADSVTVVYRRPDQPPFNPRDTRILHIVLSEVPWLHAQGWPEDRGVTVPSLTQRQRLTLNLLLEGQSRKQIAHHLNLSTHTVSDYVKAIYSHFGVQSHAELMNRFRLGDGGD